MRKLTQEEFIERCKEVHGDKYDYSKSIYTGANKKVTISCPKHGEYSTNASVHMKGCGCMGCRNDNLSFNTEEFIIRSKVIHKDKYDYSLSEYNRSFDKVKIICKTHGQFEQIGYQHLGGHGCFKCRPIPIPRTTNDEFIEKAKEVHGDKYDYSITHYTTNRNKVDIICKTHGLFKQNSGNHLSGYGCKKCGIKDNPAGYGRSKYIKKANGRICTFYTLRCFNENEEFYKIGITMRSVEKRYKCLTTMPYEYEIISQVFGEAGEIWDLESSEKKKLKKLNYSPKIYFGGATTECFTDYKC